MPGSLKELGRVSSASCYCYASDEWTKGDRSTAILDQEKELQWEKEKKGPRPGGVVARNSAEYEEFPV